MATSFFFYDLETSGFSSRDARIMQFAGRRTDLQLNPIGEPVNLLIKLTDDVLPDPDAILVTGITPQSTMADGLTEAEFLRVFTDEVALPDTIFVGYNTVRFDDEFIRCLHYRNFYDPYEWQWQDGKSRWDMLDVVRMTRALRPDGIQWPFAPDGKPSNRLELLTTVNKLEHLHAHDAMSDVEATIAIARLIRNKNEKLFDFLLSMRDKRKVEDLVTKDQPFVYASGKYPSEFQKTTVAYTICPQPKRQAVFVYDLRHDPTQYAGMTPEQLAEVWRWKKDSTEARLPVKTLAYNKCPAVAPMGVLDAASQERLQIDLPTIQKHLGILKGLKNLEQNLCKAWDILEAERPQSTTLISSEQDVDGCIYDGFFDTQDKRGMSIVRAARPQEITADMFQFKDKRLPALLPLYKARNYPQALTTEEREHWEQFRELKLLGGGQQSRMAKFYGRLQELAAKSELTGEQRYLLEELQLYAESIMPESVGE
ncbi:MAG TPA: exodeoxyribonuclease I [Candidatus Saccharimonadales bacterium]|nr:exodeoxyribonuclease I [Candidatus Saccharimonadales bacterium]